MNAILRGVAVSLAFAAVAVPAQDKPCAKADATAAEKAVDRVSTWPQLQKAYKDHRHCDKGPVADLYTEAILRLAVDWKDVDGFSAQMDQPDFKAFVHAHLKSPAAKDDLDSVYSRAKASCPAKNEKFCAELAEFVRSAQTP